MRVISKYIFLFVGLIILSFLLYQASKPIFGLFFSPLTYSKAISLLQNRKYKEAIVLFERVAKEYSGYPRSSEALIRIGCCYLRLGDKEKAKEYFQKVITKPTDLCTPTQARNCLNYLKSGQGYCLGCP